MSKLLNQIDIAICSTFDKRYEQAKQLQHNGKSLGLDIELLIGGDGTLDIPYNRIDTNEFPPVFPHSIQYPTWYSRPNNFNAWKCHRDLFQTGIDRQCNSLLMLEDDSFFEDDFLDIIGKVDDWFDGRYWDMIYFGWYSNNNLTPTDNEHVYRNVGCGGTHGVLLKREILELLVTIDPVGPFDWILSTIHKDFICYAIYPSIISQKNGFSYIEGTTLEKRSRYYI
jgi:hypothetical protein